jgi:sulfur-carrier protein
VLLTVKLYGTFRVGRFDVAQIARAPGSSIASILQDLGLPCDVVGRVMVDDRVADLAYRPAEGETLAVWPTAAR